MQYFDSQTIKDLEFDAVREMLVDYAQQPTAQLRLSELAPIHDFRKIKVELLKVEEFTRIKREGIFFPALDFHELNEEISLLVIKDSVLMEESFFRLHRANTLVNDILRAFEGMEEAVPTLYRIFDGMEVEETISKLITKVFDAKWKVRDDASPELARIRSEISILRKTIARNFAKAMKDYQGKGFLGDTGESFLNDRRVLAVYSTHKRKVSGLVISSSKTGSLTYIEPEINIQSNFELESLLDDERAEIRRILAQLTNDMRHLLPLIRAYQETLTELDFVQAKSKLALELDANLPEITENPEIMLKKAFHPLLLIRNKKLGRPTFPQQISMDKFSRMLVITGPNAGGKSITMKTIGLLQIMLQSGLLVSAAPGSKMSFFNAVLTDIGDNQSIENQLSTYSYRLKRMKLFLDVAKRRSLVLLDEFGTGSDPDLGGALAEVFFEELYNRKCFGVITTHYGNIKLKAAQLQNAVNGCMLFNTTTLEPTYQLSIGQPGSSFTFEVAEINGIPKEMIEEAKGKLSDQKVLMDKLLASLQEEKTRFEVLSNSARMAGEEASNTILDFEKKKDKFEDRLQKQQESIERNNKYLNHGRKLDQFIQQFTLNAKNKELLEDVKKYLAMERTKIEEERKQKSIKKKIEKESTEHATKERKLSSIKVGSLVRLEKTRQTGTVIEIEKDQAVVAIGVFRTKVKVDKLEFIR